MSDDEKFANDQLMFPLDSVPMKKERRNYPFDNPTGICRRRVARVGEIAARGWGIIVPYTAMAALRTSSPPVASRALATLVRVGEARRIRIVGTNEFAWGTTPLLARQYPGAKPGTRFFPEKSIEVWKPYPEFVHNQLALRVLCGVAAPADFITEPELERLRAKGDHVADGIARFKADGELWIAELQVEKSRKTGRAGGWAVLADRIVAVCLDQPSGRWTTPLGRVNSTLIVASLIDGRRIAQRVWERIRGGEHSRSVWFYFAEITNDDGSPIREYREIHPASALGPIRMWHAGRDAPWPESRAAIWSAPRNTARMSSSDA